MPRSRAPLLAALLLSACTVRPSPVPAYYENYCQARNEAEAFTVLVVRVEIQGVLDESYRFPISRQRHEMRKDSSGGYPMEICGGAISGISADNPFNGTGFNGSYSVSDISEKGLTFNMSFSWDKAGDVHGSTSASQFFSWQTPARQQVADGVLLSGWFEPPKKE
ncbi:MAG: hypothetical protein WAM82_03025 [Thermoanaerobaculia bacterium]